MDKETAKRFAQAEVAASRLDAPEPLRTTVVRLRDHYTEHETVDPQNIMLGQIVRHLGHVQKDITKQARKERWVR